MRFSYVLPAPGSYERWSDFEADLARMKEAGYQAVELQIPDPAELDADRAARSLERVGLPLCAVQTGGTYATRGNCLCTADEAVRRRTIALLRSFVDFAAGRTSRTASPARAGFARRCARSASTLRARG